MVKIGDGHKLDANTVALWRMDDSQDTASPKGTIYDCASGARHAIQTVDADMAEVRPLGPNGEYVRVFNGTSTTHQLTGDASSASALIGQHTFEAFVRPIETGSGGIIVAYDASGETSATNYLTQWTILSNGFQQVFWESGAGVNQFRTQDSGATVPDNVWSYIAYTKSASLVSFYLNGDLVDTVALGTVAAGGGSGIWRIGTDNFPQLFYRGEMRHLKMTASAKSADDIAASYNHFLNSFSLPKNDGAFLHWPMDDAADLVTDSGPNGIYLWAETSASLVKNAPALINDEGSAISVIGAGSSLASESGATTSGVSLLRQALQGPFTFEGWFQRQSTLLTSGTYAGIFSMGLASDGDASSTTNYCAVEFDPDNKVRWASEFATGSPSTHTFSYTFPDRESTYHIGIRRNATVSGLHTADLFVDGSKKSTISGVEPYTGGTVTSFYLGWGAASLPFIGTIDDVRISNVARSDAEILDSYKRGSVAVDLGGNYVVSGTWGSYGGSGSGIVVSAYDTYNNVCVGTTTTSGGGYYHIHVPRGDTLHFAEAREDSNHLGRTDNGLPQAR